MKFIITDGSLHVSSTKAHQAGEVIDADAKEVAHLENVLPFVEGEPSLKEFLAVEGNHPNKYHAHLLAHRKAKAEKAAEAKKAAEPQKGK